MVLLSLMSTLLGCSSFGLTGLLFGLEAELMIQPQEDVQFQPVPPGEEAKTDIVLESVGGLPVWIDAMEIGGVDADLFDFTNELPLPLELESDSEMQVILQFAPENIGQFRAEVSVTIEDSVTRVVTRTLIGKGCVEDEDRAGECDPDELD